MQSSTFRIPNTVPCVPPPLRQPGLPRIAGAGRGNAIGRQERALDWGILDGSVGPRIRLLRNALQAASLDASVPWGLPTGSLTVMALVAANPGSSQAGLANMAGITGPSLVGILDELEQRGLVSRTRDAVDRRRNVLGLTATGEATMAELFATVTGIEAAIREELGEAGMTQLKALLDRAIAALGKG